MPSLFQAYSNIFQAYSKHIPSIYQAYSKHIPNICQAHSKHIQYLTHAYSKHTPSLFQSCSKHKPSSLQAYSNQQVFQELVVTQTWSARSHTGTVSRIWFQPPFICFLIWLPRPFELVSHSRGVVHEGVQWPSSGGSFLNTLLGHKFDPFRYLCFLTNVTLQCW